MLKNCLFKYLAFVLIMLAASFSAHAQIPSNFPGGLTNNIDTSKFTYDSQGRPIRKAAKGSDSLQHRNPLEDSITITFRYFDSTRQRKLDSSISDFNARMPLPASYQELGNFGNPARPLIFTPNMKPGFDAGFHALDPYRYKIEDTRFFQTTRPYTELTYLLGSKSEQMGNLWHTQNRGSNFNFTFDFRFIASPGAFRNQNSNHSNLRVNTYYQTKNRRYTSYFIFLNNKLRSGENGGIQNTSNLDSLGSSSLSDPYSIPTRLGNTAFASRNVFSASFVAGTTYTENTFLYRHQYDFGQKDSIVTDSTTIKLFYPRFRVQHTFRYTKNTYSFQDNDPEPANYQQYFGMYASGDTIRYKDSWSDLTNELAIISFPEKNNLNQYLKVSAGWQLLQGQFDYYNGYTTYGKNYNNVYVTGEYRNRTRNQKWEVEAIGQGFVAGAFAGDYSALLSLKSFIGKGRNSLEMGFHNVNRTPSFVYNIGSSFPSLPPGSLNKENITRLFATVNLTKLQIKLTGEYYLVTNYAYFDSFLTAKQSASLFNVLHVGAEKHFKLSKYWNLYTEVHLQQKAGDAPINMPLLYTRDRIAFEGNFFKNLFLATGLEFRYYTSYNADNYSPFTGQFFYQNSFSTSNRPDINLFLNFRIKSFKGFIRLENLNSLEPKDGLKFTKYNFSGPYYPTRGLWFRVGIWWSFVN